MGEVSRMARTPLRRGAARHMALGALTVALACAAAPMLLAQPPAGESTTPAPDAGAAAPDTAAELPAETPAEPAPDPTVGLYLMKCAGCHTIGGGAISGPDLKVAAGFPRQTVWDAVKRMEKNVGPLTGDEVERLTDFILSPDAGPRLEAQRQQMRMREAASLEPPDAVRGRALFLGSVPFGNGGLSCAACHQAGGRGGNLAASLEDSFTRLGDQALLATTENPGFPVMRAIYADRPVTKQEAVHIVKFLEEVSANPAPPLRAPLHAAGVAGAAGLLVLLGRGTRKRAAGTRARMVADAKRRGAPAQSSGRRVS